MTRVLFDTQGLTLLDTMSEFAGHFIAVGQEKVRH